MLWHVVKRGLQAIPLLVGIATILFFVVHMAPGDPINLYLQKHREQFATGRPFDPELEKAIRRKYGLDRPLPEQYLIWLGSLARGDLGESFQYRRSVSSLIAERVPYTLQLTVVALLSGAIVGIALGVVSAVKPYSFLDKFLTLTSVLVYSIPQFWLAVMCILVFAVSLNWMPISQTRSLDYTLLSAPAKVADRLWHLVLPVLVLMLGSAAGTARYMRNELLGVLNEEYVIAARARGLPESRVVLRHALRNAMMPIITIYGLELPFLVGGAVVVEKVFAWPGIGALAIDAVAARDYPVILATSLIAAVLVIAGNLLADVMYAVVDPRVSLDGKRID
ncbi:MAG: ABC transporter permease [Acidobacteria bacterium]|nr:ABC transporter permease [Acidobacteriota bacterium]